MTVKAVTACYRSSADMGASFGSRTTTMVVRTFAPEMLRATKARGGLSLTREDLTSYACRLALGTVAGWGFG